MIGTMILQCMRGACIADIEAAGLLGYYTMHDHGVFPADANGVPFTASYIQCTGDPLADIADTNHPWLHFCKNNFHRKMITSLFQTSNCTAYAAFTNSLFNTNGGPMYITSTPHTKNLACASRR